MRFLLCGGGTAGHVMPAIAIAEIIEKEFENAEIAFAGRSNGDENRAYIKTGHRLYTTDISGIPRSISINSVKSIFKIIKSSRNAKRIIREFNPDMIIGTGGYVSFPFIRQGQRLGIRTAMHESNVSLGLVTRLLGPRCDLLLLNHDETKNHLKSCDNALTVGNPTRSRFSDMTKAEARRRLGIANGQILVVSFGGSLGSRRFNEIIPKIMRDEPKQCASIRHIHATGRVNYEEIKAKYPELTAKSALCRIVPYIEDMPTVLTAADIAITRSGAITVSEICESATPAILIPSPNVTANHQYLNAKYMKDKGAAQLIEEKELTQNRLSEALMTLVKNQKAREEMAARAASLYKKDTDEKIAVALRAVFYEKRR